MFQAERLYEFMKLKPSVMESKSPRNIDMLNGNIAFQNVHFWYNDRCILSDLNLEIKEGQKTAIVGSSGSGKSTILKLIGRFYDPLKAASLLETSQSQKFHMGIYATQWDSFFKIPFFCGNS